MKISKRFVDRARPALRKYQRILESAKARDVGESDTMVIVGDILTDVLGYDKYQEITTEFAVRSTFCDLAVRVSGELRYLIEVKSIGTDLKENHLRQACDYAANQGVEWVLLTNGARWQAHRMRFEQPIQNDLVFSVDLLDPATRPNDLLEMFFLISREAGSGAEIDRYYRGKEATSRYVIAQLALSEVVLDPLRRQLKKMFPGVRVTSEALATLLRNEVIKRDALEGEKATIAGRLVRRAMKKRTKARTDAAAQEEAVPIPVTPVKSPTPLAAGTTGQRPLPSERATTDVVE